MDGLHTPFGYIPTAIYSDSHGDIWLGTVSNGLLRYSWSEKHLESVPGTHGLTCFNPMDVSTKRSVPLLFEDLKIHNRLVRPGKDGAISKALSYRPDVRLRHNENGFSISFSALDYCEHERVHYYYRMEGFDKYWIDARNNREAYYANLPSGTYTFKVRVTNNDKSIVETETKQNKAFPLQESKGYMTEGQNHDNGNRQTVLVVDDDAEVVHYLKTLLTPYYNVLCRFDADSVYKAMGEETPDIVISDVVMPGRSGYDLCRQIKDDLQLCHIPVILVTAKATTENQVEGLDTGADAYVTKPFDPKYLLALIKSQLKNREKVRNLLSNTTKTDKIEEVTPSEYD